ncbi:MAG: toprim domain-containing protein [Patescibacteria group bacterium]|nr:toprim domain-containing protein [Patescibacteria group bacterium]
MENPIDRLTLLFEHFPGIGPRQARRFVQYLLSQNASVRSELAESVKALGSHTALCKHCYRYFLKTSAKSERCSICSNPSRDAGLLFVIEKDADIQNVERGGFKGLYFVLGGTIPLAQEHPEKYVRLRELLKRVESEGKAHTLREIILGLSATTEGDHTRMLIQERLLALSQEHSFQISALGRGLSTGSELEYADPETISQALGNRH